MIDLTLFIILIVSNFNLLSYNKTNQMLQVCLPLLTIPFLLRFYYSLHYVCVLNVVSRIFHENIIGQF